MSEGGINSQDLAASAVREIAEELDFEQAEEVQQEEMFEPEEMGQELEGQEVESQPQVEEPEEYDETFSRLQELGINLGMNPSEVPAELRPVFDRISNEALLAFESMQQRINEVEMARAEMRQFAEKLEKDPQKILLTMAITKPEQFQQAIQAYEEMQADERYRNMIVRELQAEAKLSAAERQQIVYEQRARNQKIQVVTKATHVAADKLGVDRELAERMVAMQIQANGGDIDPRAVEGVVASLRPKGPVQRTTTQQKVQQVKRAPNAPVEGTGRPAPKSAIQDEASPGLTKVSRNPFLDLVRDAGRRMRHTEG